MHVAELRTPAVASGVSSRIANQALGFAIRSAPRDRCQIVPARQGAGDRGIYKPLREKRVGIYVSGFKASVLRTEAWLICNKHISSHPL